MNAIVGEVREGCDRVGFEVVTVDGRRGPLASTNITRYYSLFYSSIHIESLTLLSSY